MTYQRLNNLTGWGVFAFALVVYLLTMAPTASFWDCGEFIACSNELEVTHPPGAPMFLLIGRIFAMFSFGDPQRVAWLVNLVSVLASAFTALFTTWATTMLARKAVTAMTAWDESLQTRAVLLAGALAGLTCTFADSVWFNAVEAEVYALSSFCTALVIWLMLKWEARADEPDHLRWIVLIAYAMGLSIGVHLLNLLTIPALALVYYFRKYPFSWKGVATAFGIGVVALGIIQYGILQYTFVIAWQFEKIFTGTVSRAGEDMGGFGLPMGTGFAVFALLLVAALIGTLIYAHRNKRALLSTAILSGTVILLGFSSYAIIFIRSHVDAPIDMNNPENILSFLSYMRREQYGDRPLLYGPMYNAQPEYDAVTGRAITEADGMQYMLLDSEQKYVEDTEKEDYVFRSEDKVFFPRMHDASRYNAGPYGYSNYVRLRGSSEEDPYDDRPTRGEDLKFFFEYQLNHMYLRYFMWNFAGRRSDLQEASFEGTGLGSYKDPEIINNKGNNHFFYLPLLLGILGLIWHFTTHKRDASVVALLFFFTGVAIILYLNQTPNQPRERDYSYAGSFQTFAIWVGMGSLFVIELLQKYLKKSTFLVTALLVSVSPALMGFQGWDDHSRQGRWIDIEFAKNLLDSCDPNAILFTGGDNDTFPLWYVQEVEGYRTDVRVVNLELLISDWYINLMRQKHNDAEGIPLSLNPRDYVGEAGMVIQPYKSHPITLPTPDSSITWQPRTRGYILRKDSVMINMMQQVAAAGWKRPVYFANMLGNPSYLNLNDFFAVEGLAYRVTPRKYGPQDVRDPQNAGRIDVAKAYDRLVNQYKFRGLNDPSVNFDEHARGAIAGNYRSIFARVMAGMANRIDSLQTWKAQGTAPAGADAEIGDLKAKMRVLAQTVRNKITYEAVYPQMPQMLMLARPLMQAGIDDEADAEFAKIRKYALAELDAMKKVGVMPEGDNMSYQALLMNIQYLAERKRLDEARELAAKADSYTGGTEIQDILEKQFK